MITQQYINGYIDALNNLLKLYKTELNDLRYLYYKDKILHKNIYVQKRNLVLNHINMIKNIKTEYKILIKKINKINKL